MCGIAGIIDFAGRPIDRDALGRACTAMAHRGPDDRGTWVHESSGFSAGLAHTRLAVIAPTPDGRQPMTDASGHRAVAYNGELYNYRALRGLLGGDFRTDGDTEVVLRACITGGPAALGGFDAMWALAFVDGAGRCGHLSRDPFGIKPLYYVHHDRRLLFASELATLKRLGDWPTELDAEALGLFLLLGFIPHPYSIYRHVRKLPPGHVLEFDESGPSAPRRYVRLPSPPRAVPTYEEATEEVRRRVEQAVLSQRVADVPLGAFLSGGLDSSVVAACLARAGGGRVRTFSIGYAEHARYDETRYAELVARHLGTEHHAFQLSFGDVLAVVEPMLAHQGEPFADSSLLPTALVSRYTREHVTVALSGDGGDELFGGYWRYLAHPVVERYRQVPALIRNGLIRPLLSALPAGKSNRWLNRARQARKLLRGDLADPLDRHVAWARHIDGPPALELIGAAATSAAAGRFRELLRESAAAIRPDAPPRTPMEEILLADLGVGLPADMLFKVDLASMFNSLEVRVPLLSKGLVDYVSGLPIEYRIAGGRGKRILKNAFREVLPAEVVDRPKMGFEVPIGEFLRSELRDRFHDVVAPPVLSDLGIRPAAVAAVYDAHAARREDCADVLWSLLVLCSWRRAR